MNGFEYKGKSLYCENVRVKDIAKAHKTPLYVYSYKAILSRFTEIKKAFSALKPLICYSVKANSNLSILKALIKAGAGLDIVSGGELYRAKIAECPPKKIVYASVGKTSGEIKQALKYGILMFNIESEPELEKINNIAGRLKKKPDVSLRVNPDVKPKTHEYIITGKEKTKFGIDINSARRIFLARHKYKNLNMVGVHIHIGSQIMSAEPFVEAINKINNLIEQLKKEKVLLKYFDIGGGLGIVYNKEFPQSADKFARAILPFLRKMKMKIILEPGRFIVGNAGILVAKVIYIKDTPHKRFIIVDAAMNDLLRPSLYNAYHRIVPVCLRAKSQELRAKLADVVGPVCESGDFLAKDRKINVDKEDYLAVMSAGAYGFSMSSNYNSRPRVTEVLVKNNRSYLIRKRETYRDLIHNEMVLDF